MCLPAELLLGDRVVDLTRGQVQTPNGAVRLTTTEHELVRFLTGRLGQAVDRDELHSEVWGHAATVFSRALDTTVRRLRRKLEEDPKNPQHLLTVHGTGYRLVATQPDTHPLVGRERDLQRLALCDQAPVVGLVGVPGVGTSSLARAWQRDAVWVSWNDHASPHEALAHALALSAKSSLAELLRALGDRVLGLDNATPSAADSVRMWLAERPVRVVYAAHQALGLSGEQIVAVGPLDSLSSRALLVQLGCSQPEAEHLSQQAAGHPLTLTRLALDPTDGDTLLSDAFGQLPHSARQLLAVVKALQPTTLAAVRSVMSDGAVDAKRLTQSGWLANKQGVLRVAAWVAESIDVSTADAPLANRAVDIAGPVDPGASRVVSKDWIRYTGVMRAGVYALLRLGRHEEAARVARATVRTLHWTGPYEPGAALADAVLSHPLPAAQHCLLHVVSAPLTNGSTRRRHVDEATRIAASQDDSLLRCRCLLTDPGEGPHEIDNLRLAVDLARQTGHQSLVARALGRLSMRLARVDDPEAHPLYMQAIEAAQHAEDRWEEAIIAGNYAGVLRRIGDVDGALHRYRSTFETLGEFGDRWNQRAVCTGLGTLLHQLMRFDEAHDVYAQGLELAESLGDATAASLLRTDMMGLHLDRGEIPSATMLDDALREHRLSGDRLYESVSLCNQGIAWRRRGQAPLARIHLNKALDIATEIGAHKHMHEFRAELAWIDALDGDLPRACDAIDDAIAALIAIPTRRSIAARHLLKRAEWAPLSAEQQRQVTELAHEFPSPDGTDWQDLRRFR